MNNKINEIKPQYIYAVQPVKLFETEDTKRANKQAFNFGNEQIQTNYNPFHPNVSNSEKGNRLDLMG